MVFTLAGGAIFGPFLGVIFNLIGATCGAAFSFLISRHLIYDWFARKRGKKLNYLIAEANRRGWICIAILRLFPIVPFNLVNYGLGLTDVPFTLYLVTTFIFLIPAEIIYTYCGYAGIDALSRPGHFYQNGGLLLLGPALLFLGLLALIKKRRLKKLSISQENLTSLD